MVKVSYQINILVIALVVLQLAFNEARRLSLDSNITSNESTESEKVNEQKSLSIQFVNGTVNRNDDAGESTKALNARDSSKYSYFYVGRWTWHIPLWFTLWFSFYVTFNVFRAILGHKVGELSKVLIKSFNLFLHLRSIPMIMLDEREISAPRQHPHTASSTD